MQNIQALTNLPGIHNYYSSIDRSWTRISGGTGSGTVKGNYPFTHRCHKSVTRKGGYLQVGVSKFRLPTPYQRGIAEFIHSPGQWDVLSGTLTTRWVGTITGSIQGNALGVRNVWQNGLYPVVDQNAKARAETQCLVKMGNQKAQLGTFLAESRKTAIHLADRSIDLLRVLHAIKRRRWSDVPKALRLRKDPTKLTADLWLEYQYGWKPLLSELHDIHGVLVEGLGRPLVVKASSTVTVSDSFDESRLNPGNRNLIANGSAERGHKCQLAAFVDDQFLRKAQQIGLVNPAEVGWELVPYSFVVDWFIPIGQTLSALTATKGLKFAWGSFQLRGSMNLFVHERAPAGFVGGTMPSYVHRATSFERSVYGGFPRPQIYAKESPFSSTRITSALALLRNLK